MARRDDILHALRRALTPPAGALAALVAVSAAGLAWTFLGAAANQKSPVAYASYALSAYTLVAACESVAAARPLDRLRAALPKNPLVNRLVTDADFRAKLSFAASSVLRVIWTVFNAVMGVRLRSAWYDTLAAYYLFLSVMRGLLVRHLRGGEGTARTRAEASTQRACGVMLIVLTVMLAGMTVLLNSREGGFTYAGNLIYAMAAWTFYTLISCVARFVRVWRSEGAGLFLSSAYAVRLAEALVSLFALEVAMLTTFGTPEQDGFNMVMINCTGMAILVIVVLTGAGLIRRAGRALRELDETEGR